jgi:hypothetical protein
MSKLLPAYIIHQICIICYLYFAESLRTFGYVNEKKLVTNDDSEIDSMMIYLQRMKQIFCLICLSINFVNLYFFIRQTHHLGLLSVLKLYRLWSFVDLVIIIVNFIIGTGVFRNDNPNVLEKGNLSSFVLSVSNMRVIESFGIMFMWFKSLYYLQLIPRIAPLIDIIFVILRDMKHFLLIFLISTISFIQTYYILGRNQMEIDKHHPVTAWNDRAKPPYASFLGSLDHVIQSSLGAFDSSHYFGNAMTKYIYPLFLLMIFS